MKAWQIELTETDILICGEEGEQKSLIIDKNHSLAENLKKAKLAGLASVLLPLSKVHHILVKVPRVEDRSQATVIEEHLHREFHNLGGYKWRYGIIKTEPHWMYVCAALVNAEWIEGFARELKESGMDVERLCSPFEYYHEQCGEAFIIQDRLQYYNDGRGIGIRQVREGTLGMGDSQRLGYVRLRSLAMDFKKEGQPKPKPMNWLVGAAACFALAGGVWALYNQHACDVQEELLHTLHAEVAPLYELKSELELAERQYQEVSQHFEVLRKQIEKESTWESFLGTLESALVAEDSVWLKSLDWSWVAGQMAVTIEGTLVDWEFSTTNSKSGGIQKARALMEAIELFPAIVKTQDVHIITKEAPIIHFAYTFCLAEGVTL